MRLSGNIILHLLMPAVFLCGPSFIVAQESFLTGSSIFVFKAPREASGSPGARSGGRNSQTGTGAGATVNQVKGPTGKKPVAKPTAQANTVREVVIAPEDWINMDADLAIEERKVSDSEPFLSLSNGFLNSRYTFCESPQFPDAARRARKKLVNSRMLVTVAKYGGLLNAEELEGDASFRAGVYKILGSMQFRQSYFMGRPIRIEGVLSFSQNPANELLCRDASRDVEIPPFIEGGDLSGLATVCDAPPFPSDAKAAGLKTVEAKVEVIVGEDGKVSDAKLIGGHPAFGASAVNAALKMVFPKSGITNKPAKVRGTIVFTQTSGDSVQCKRM